MYGVYTHIILKCGVYTHIILKCGVYTHIILKCGVYTHSMRFDKLCTCSLEKCWLTKVCDCYLL